MQLKIDRIHSAIGTILVVGDDRRLHALDFEDCEDRMLAILEANYESVELIENDKPSVHAEKVQRYMDGDLGALDDIEIETGGTAFQREVWSALRTIPTGTTASYGDIARRIGRDGSARAVGMANSRNPVVLVVPCHRVIGADGTLTGFGGGLERKRWLLEHEGIRIQEPGSAN